MVLGVGWNTVQDDLASELKMKHPKPFQGTAKLKDFKLHLQFTSSGAKVKESLVCTSWKRLCQNR